MTVTVTLISCVKGDRTRLGQGRLRPQSARFIGLGSCQSHLNRRNGHVGDDEEGDGLKDDEILCS